MRLLTGVFFFIAAALLITFWVTNLGTRVAVSVFNRSWPDVSISIVVVAAFTIGAAFVALIAIVEGAKIRFENHRLRREVHKLETEINYQRTQPPSGSRPEPDDEVLARTATPSEREEPAEAPTPTAPVYEPAPKDDRDDDIYSGGRAV